MSIESSIKAAVRGILREELAFKPTLMSKSRLAQELDVSTDYIDKLIRSGKLRIGRHIKYLTPTGHPRFVYKTVLVDFDIPC